MRFRHIGLLLTITALLSLGAPFQLYAKGGSGGHSHSSAHSNHTSHGEHTSNHHSQSSTSHQTTLDHHNAGSTGTGQYGYGHPSASHSAPHRDSLTTTNVVKPPAVAPAPKHHLSYETKLSLNSSTSPIAMSRGMHQNSTFKPLAIPPVKHPEKLNITAKELPIASKKEPHANKVTKKAPDITTPYKRPSGATTKAQRESVQGKPCVDCGATTPKQYADHKDPLVKEYYRTGTIDKARMRDVDSVQSQCPTCSNKQGAEMSQFSRQQKKDLGL